MRAKAAGDYAVYCAVTCAQLIWAVGAKQYGALWIATEHVYGLKHLVIA
jgi:hypothetical protein